jgi:hypothetical protein
MNRAYSEEEYKKKKSEFLMLPRKEKEKIWQDFSAKIPKKSHHNSHVEEVFGDYLL